MDRNLIIDFIPKPRNEEVIIYDTSLKDLSNENVIEGYKDTLPIYKKAKMQIEKNRIITKQYEEQLNTIYLFKANWSEEDYLYNLQNDKKTYATLFKPIKKIESQIEVLTKKVKMINDKIEIQKSREQKEIDNLKNNNEKIINENVEELIRIKDLQATFTVERNKTNEQLAENEKDFKILQGIVEDIKNGNCVCRFCGHKMSNVSKNSNFYKKTIKNMEENKKEFQRLLEKKEEADKHIEEYNKKIKEIKATLNNAVNFKTENKSFYRKKSVEILRLEGTRDAFLEQIDKLEKEKNANSEIKTKKFTELKDRINKIELSIENLQKIKEIKQTISEKVDEINKIKQEFEKIVQKMEKYKKFLTIFYKIYEQKAQDFCGEKFKFKIFEFDEYDLIKKFEIYYNNVEYKSLTRASKNKVESILMKKFFIDK